MEERPPVRARRWFLGVTALMTVAHASLRAAAVALVLRRGRNDIGGVLDVSVAAIGLGGLIELIRRADQAMYAAKEASRSALP